MASGGHLIDLDEEPEFYVLRYNSNEEDKLTDKMKKVNVSSEKSKNDATTSTDEPVEMVDYSQVTKLLQSYKNADIKLLEKTGQAVKAFLSQSKDNLGRIMETKEFLPFLVKCLKVKAEFATVQANAAWIAAAILKDGTEKQVRQLGGVEGVALIVKMFGGCSDPIVHEYATDALARIAGHDEVRPKLVSTALLGEVLNKLVTILKCKDPLASKNLVENISQFMAKVVLEDAMAQIKRSLGIAGNKSKPSLTPSILKSSLPILSLILDSEVAAADARIQANVLQCLCMATTHLHKIDPFVALGLCPKITAYLGRPDNNGMHMGAAVALASIAAEGPVELLKFLKALKGTDGLKHYWHSLKHPESYYQKPEHQRVHMAVLEFINAISSLVYHDNEREPTATIAVIDSGYAHALVSLLENKCPCKKFQVMAIGTLGSLCSSTQLPKAQKEVLAGLGIIPLAIRYLTSSDNGVLGAAAAIVAGLVRKNPQQRDVAIQSGILPTLQIVFENNIKDVEGMFNCMKMLENLLKMKPLATLETFKEVPTMLKNFFYTIVMTTSDLMITALACVKQFAKYGSDGIEAIFATPRLATKMLTFLSSRSPAVQEEATELILKICQVGTAQHRRKLLEMDVLECFKELLLSRVTKTRIMALECLLVFMAEELKSNEKLCIESLRSTVMAEITKGSSETRPLARNVYKKMIE